MTVFPQPKAPGMAQSHQELRRKGHQEHTEAGGGGGGWWFSNSVVAWDEAMEEGEEWSGGAGRWVGNRLGIGSLDLRKKMILTCVRHV
jgi:hypothetical protein